MHRFLIVFIPVFLLFSSASFAIEVTDLYAAQQRVATQDKASRDAVAGEALQTVLLKVVGSREKLTSISKERIAEIAPSLIVQHEYFDENAAKFAYDNTAPEQLAVRLQFDEIKLNQQLLDWGLPVWNKSRPEVLLLLIMNDGRRKQVLLDENVPAKIAVEVAKSRGVPVLIPLMDLADYKMLEMPALWAGDFDAAMRFSTRYQTPLVVTARMAKQADDQWQIEWQYKFLGEVMQWQSGGETIQAIQLGMNDLVDNLAGQFSYVKSSVPTRFLLEVDGVSGFVSHQKVMQSLSGLTYAENVQQHVLIEGVLTVSLDYFGGEKALQAAISGDSILIPLSDIINADRLYYEVRH